MATEKSIEILKTAILLERKGKAFYTHVANQAADTDVKEFFQNMADEEDEHIKFLTEQFNNFTKNKTFSKVNKQPESDTSEEILSEKIKSKIDSASFEASAISAAIDMENKAVAVYSERARNAESKEEKEFYQWLSDWESSHHKLLYHIDQELKEKIWNDNKFFAF